MRLPPDNQPNPILPPRDLAGRFISSRESTRNGDTFRIVLPSADSLWADRRPVSDDLLPTRERRRARVFDVFVEEDEVVPDYFTAGY